MKQVGDTVVHPLTGRQGLIIQIRQNPACFMRELTIRWNDGEEESLEEIELGPLED